MKFLMIRKMSYRANKKRVKKNEDGFGGVKLMWIGWI